VRRPPGVIDAAPSASPWYGPRQLLPHLATAALAILLLIAGLYTFGSLRPKPPEQILGAVDGPVHLEFLWDSQGGAEAISSAYGVGVDPQGNVWVADRMDRFHIVAPDGTYLELWGTSGSGQGEFEFLSRNAPVPRGYGDVAFDTEGNIYVADTGNSRIQKFDPDRTFLTSWGGEGENDGQFLSPSGIAVGPDGIVYVSDEARADIQRFDRDGRFLGTIGEYGQDPGQFMSPAGVAVASTGDVYVADYSNQRIQHFTASGEFLNAWGKYGREPGQFNNPNDVAVDAWGHVYVADDFNNRLQVFGADGRFLATIGTFGSDPGQLNDPLGVAAGPNGVAYVSDSDSIQAFRLVPTDEG
jgi:tripartite motif-containing protein 71